MTRTPAPALSESEAAIVARFDAAPTPPEVVVAGEQRDRLAEALHIVGTRPGFTELNAWTRWTTLAAAAIAALPPSPAEEAVKRVILDTPGDLLSGDVVVAVDWDDASEYTISVNRAALASPAPAPQGEEGDAWRWHREPGTGDEWEQVWSCCGGPYAERPSGHYADCAADR